MKKKQGISLIVLVITIIVMIILAASVVLTLSNSGIIGRANEAVEKTNIKEVQQLATIIWADEFMDGKRGDTLKDAVLDKLKDYKDKYTIIVTDKGVTVEPGSDLTPSEPTSPYTLSGAWTFDEEITVTDGIEQEIKFVSKGKKYTSMVLTSGVIEYSGVDSTDQAYDSATTEWASEAFPILDFGETPQPVSEEFYNWFMDNALDSSYLTTVTIEGVKYYAPGWIPWDEWVASDHNTGGYLEISVHPDGLGAESYLYTSDGKPLVFADTNEKVYVPMNTMTDGSVIIVDPSYNEQ